MAFKKVEVDPPIETILPLKGAYRQVALEAVIGCVDRFIGEGGFSWLCQKDRIKVIKEVDKITEVLQRKMDKIKGTTVQCDMEGEEIKEWLNAKEAAMYLKLVQSCISAVCNKKHGRTQHGGYKWKFKNE